MITVLEKPISLKGGVRLPSNKAMSLGEDIKTAGLPDYLKIPIRQHIGSSAEVIVKPNDKVLKGQVIARAKGYVSVPIHASTSGRVVEIIEHTIPSPSGSKLTCVVIETDGEDKWVEKPHLADSYHKLNPIAIQKIIFEAGIVGLGGAGFPSAIKLIPGLNLEISLLILNAAECEPYISCDEALIHNHAQDVINGLEILANSLQVDECVIAIKESNRKAIDILQKSLKKYSKQEIKLIKVPDIYPIGGERQLIKSITGVDVPMNGLPRDIGVVCYNVGTAFAVKEAVVDARPLISRIVTVTGSGIARPCNLEVLIGTPIDELIKQCGGYEKDFDHLIVGGPMMGFSLFSDKAPVTKTTNCLLAINKNSGSSVFSRVSPCIRCDECARVCPVGLQPQQLNWYAEKSDINKLKEYHLFDCIECGCCSYVCPSHIPLVDLYRKTKSYIWEKQQKQLKAEKYKKRYISKKFRLRQQIKEKQQQKSKQIEQYISDAVSRVQIKRKTKQLSSYSVKKR